MPREISPTTDAALAIVSRLEGGEADLVGFAGGTTLRVGPRAVKLSEKATVSLRREAPGRWVVGVETRGRVRIELAGFLEGRATVTDAGGRRLEASSRGGVVGFEATSGRYFIEARQ